MFVPCELNICKQNIFCSMKIIFMSDAFLHARWFQGFVHVDLCYSYIPIDM